jgi:hypothetical protein
MIRCLAREHILLYKRLVAAASEHGDAIHDSILRSALVFKLASEI